MNIFPCLKAAHILFHVVFAQFEYRDKLVFILYSFSDFTFKFSHLANAFIQSNLQMRTIEAIKTNKKATTCECYDKYRLD